MGLEHRRYATSGFLSSILSKLPHALRDRFSAAAEDIVVATLASSEPSVRWRLFDALSATNELGNDRYFFVSAAPEPFLINLQDAEGPSKELFVLRAQTEFRKFELALKLLGEARGERDLLLDVGGNIGTICIPAIARGLFSRAVAIEPHPANCRLLRANLALNGVQDGVVLIEAACGPADGEMVELEVSDVNFGDHRVFVSTEAGKYQDSTRKRIKVPSIRLDSSVAEADRARSFIWMDVQGYEGHVLQGAQALLQARTPIGIELDPHIIGRSGGFPLMKQALADYKGFYDLSRPETFNSIAELSEVHDDLASRGAYTDLLFI